MLKNYNQEPREENWQSIEAKLREEHVHWNIKSKFDNFAVSPDDNNWKNIQGKLKQPVQSHSYRNALRFAASICLLILAITFNSDNKEQTFSDVFQGLATTETPVYKYCMDPEIIALDIVKPVVKGVRSKSKKNPIAATKQKQLLDIILASDEDIESSVDSALIAELIRPVDILSEDNMFASVGGSYFYYKEGNDFKKMYYLPEVNYNLEIPSDSLDAIIHKTIRP